MLLILTVAVAYQLFVEPIVGIADNRDFARLMDPAGIDYVSVADYRETVFRFVETKFGFVNPSSNRYLTSERPILGAAKALNRLISKDGRFDVRVLGFCNLVLYVGAIFIFLRAFRSKGLLSRLFIYGAVLLMCVDVKWVSYFNSFYCESASLIFLFSTVGLALLCLDNDRQETTAWFLWVGYLGSAFLFWMAKSQNTAFAPCLALGAWYLFPNSKGRDDVEQSDAGPSSSRRPLDGFLVLRVLGVAAIPVGIAWAFAANAYGVTMSTNAKVAIAEEILPNSPRPAEDRRELGVEQDGSSFYGIAGFYARHPIRWWRMAQRQMKEAFGYLLHGNFTRTSGLGPKAQSQAFNSWSELKQALYPRNLILLICLFVAYAILAVVKARWLDEGRAARMRTLVGPVLGLGCALEFIVTVTFEANGTAKHLFIFNVAVDLCVLMAVLSLAEASARLCLRRSAAAPVPKGR